MNLALTRFVQDRCINLNGTPGAPGQNGKNGFDGAPGHNSASSAPGSPGSNGTPGAPGTMGTPGGNAGSISVVLSRASADSMFIDVGQHREISSYPISIRAVGGPGGAGGHGGHGGSGGRGGNGYFYISEPEHRKYRFTVTEYPGNDVGSTASQGYMPGGASVGYQAGGASVGYQAGGASVGYQAGGSASVGYQAGNAGSAIVKPSPRTLSESDTFEHLSSNKTRCKSTIRLDAAGWTVNGRKEGRISIIDWSNQAWQVSIQPSGATRALFVLQSSTSPSYTTATLKFLNGSGEQCDATLSEKIIPPEYAASDGGNGGHGGPAGVGAPGAAGGDGGHITIASQDALLLLHVEAAAKGGLGGIPGNHGKPGSGGQGGSKGPSPGRGGHAGKDGKKGQAIVSPAVTGPSGRHGSVQYIRLGENGEVLQQSPTIPALTVSKWSATPHNGSRLFEPGEPFLVSASVSNLGSISIPPSVTLKLTGDRSVSSAKAIETVDWIHPNNSVETTYECKVIGDIGETIHMRVDGIIDGAHPVERLKMEVGPIAWPVKVTTVLAVPTSSANEVFKLGARILNLSGIPSGSHCGRDITLMLKIRDGIKFAEDDRAGIPTPTSPNEWSFNVSELGSDDSLTIEKQCKLADGLKNFEEVEYEICLFYRNSLVSRHPGKIKHIPVFNPEAAQQADVLLMTHSGLANQAYENIVARCSALNLRVATWDYIYQPDFELGNLFTSKLIICFLQGNGSDLGKFSTKAAVLAHFFSSYACTTPSPESSSSQHTIQKVAAAPRARLTCEGKDLDSSILFVTHDINVTRSRLMKVLSTTLSTLSKETLSAKFFGKPKVQDLQSILDDIRDPLLPCYQDFAVYHTSKFDPKKVEGGLRSKWALGTAQINRSALSLLQRVYLTKDVYASASNGAQKWAEFDMALRTAMTTAQKMRHLASQDPTTPIAQPKLFEFTESALYYDLKAEFFFHQRPMFFFEQVVDLILFNQPIYAKPPVIESVIRVLHRLLNAAYWKSFGTSPLRSRWYHVEAGINAIKTHLKNLPGIDMKSIETNAKSTAKSKDRLKWRTITLPDRLRVINLDNLNKTEC